MSSAPHAPVVGSSAGSTAPAGSAAAAASRAAKLATSRRELDPEKSEHELAILAKLRRSEQQTLQRMQNQRRALHLSASDPEDAATLALLEANGVARDEFLSSHGACVTELEVFQVVGWHQMRGLRPFHALRRLEVMLQRIPRIQGLDSCVNLQTCVAYGGCQPVCFEL